MDTRRALVVTRVAFAFLGFSALVTEIATLVARHRFVAGNFFSFFTVESNTLAVIALVVAALATAAGRTGPGLDLLRGAVTFYMTTVIVIFIVLLSGLPASELTAVPWDNTVLHYIMPIALIVDWLFDGGSATIRYRQALVWMVFPLAYLAYSLIRGPIVNWYPYPFMDPDAHGYVSVIVTSVVIAAVLAGIAWLIASVPRWRARIPGVGRPA
jgi:hypothetical protein